MALPKKTRFHRIVRELRTVMEETRLGPEYLIGSALAVWCKHSFPSLPPSGLRTIAVLKHDPAVCAFVDFVKEEELLEATYWFSSAYAQLSGEERRKQLAMFFTPPSLTKRLLDDRGGAACSDRVPRF